MRLALTALLCAQLFLLSCSQKAEGMKRVAVGKEIEGIGTDGKRYTEMKLRIWEGTMTRDTTIFFRDSYLQDTISWYGLNDIPMLHYMPIKIDRSINDTIESMLLTSKYLPKDGAPGCFPCLICKRRNNGMLIVGFYLIDKSTSRAMGSKEFLIRDNRIVGIRNSVLVGERFMTPKEYDHLDYLTVD